MAYKKPVSIIPESSLLELVEKENQVEPVNPPSTGKWPLDEIY